MSLEASLPPMHNDAVAQDDTFDSPYSLAWLVYLASGLTITVIYFLLPSPAIQEMWFSLIRLLTPLVVLLGIFWHRPTATSPWYLLAGSLLLLFLGDMVWLVYEIRFRIATPFPSLADGLYLVGYLLLVMSLARIARIRTNDYAQANALDVAIMAVCVCLLSWIFLIEPYRQNPNLTLLGQLLSLIYLFLDLAMLAVLARLLLIPGKQPCSLFALLLGIGVFLITDVMASALMVQQTYYTGHPVGAGWLLGNTFFALAALHPSMRTLSTPGMLLPIEPTRRHLTVLVGTSLSAPLAFVVQDLRDQPVDALLIAGASALLFLLVLTRANQLVGALTRALASLELSMSRERVLRNAAVALVATSDREKMYDVAIEAVSALLRTRPLTIRLVLVADDDLVVVAAAGGRETTDLPVQVDGQSLPNDVWQSLLAQQAITAWADAQPKSWRALGFVPETKAIFVTPLVIQQQLRGAIMVANCHEFSAEIKRALEVLSVQVALALESATLAESLLQHRSEERFRSLIQNASDMIAVVDPHGTLCYSSPSLERILGGKPEDVTGVGSLSLIRSDDDVLIQSFLAMLLESPGSNATIECRIQQSDGSWLNVEMIGNNLLHDPYVSGIVLTIRDVSERKSFEDQLYHQMFHDALTQLPNRPLFIDRLQHALARNARQSHALPIGILFMDLDGFKFVNDSLGHETGDQLLVAVAERLQRSIRPQDTIARFGGDEFAILLEDLAYETDAVYVAERIIEQLQQPFTLDGREMFITCSIGIALSASATDQPADLLRYADAAMYRAKHTGKARYEIFDISMNAAALERLELEQDLRRALDRREFKIHYQPLVKLATGSIVGLEALVRWDHPRRGMVSPGLFIPCAEETGLILAIGEWVLEESCRQVQLWQQCYAGAEQLEISVNLSARQFQAPNLVQTVADVLHRTGLPPTSLKLEITESVVMSDVTSTIGKLRELKQLGVQLAVDDFGTGYSSLSYLKRFPVDTLKIDQAFVAGLGQNAEDTAIVQAVNTLAHTLGLSVTAEGVESAAVAIHLQQLGCDLGQGYYFAKPLASDLVEVLLGQPLAELRANSAAE